MANNIKTTTPKIQEPKADSMLSRKPIHEIRMGRIKAAIWQNETDGVTRYNVTFGKLIRTLSRGSKRRASVVMTCLFCRKSPIRLTPSSSRNSRSLSSHSQTEPAWLHRAGFLHSNLSR